jgi:hypothetical protein
MQKVTIKLMAACGGIVALLMAGGAGLHAR